MSEPHNELYLYANGELRDPGRAPAPAVLGECRMESAWRRIAEDRAQPDPNVIQTARWKSGGTTGRVRNTSVNADHYVAAIILSPGRSHLTIDGRTVHEGAAPIGSTLVTAPMQEIQVDSEHPCDVFHLFIPPSLIEQAIDGPATGARRLFGGMSRVDSVLLHAASSWIDLQAESGGDPRLFSECLGQMVLHRIVGSHLQHRSGRLPVSSLQSWRLRRAIDYVEARLNQVISLKDMAAAAELSPMHFAAQFRRAMGTTPYRYVMRRRIESAQQLIRQSDHKLAEIAMMTGFSSHAHFSSAFRATMGVTPRQWRESVVGTTWPDFDDAAPAAYPETPLS